MKITLAELCLLPVFLVVSGALVIVFTSLNQPRITYRYHVAFNDARHLRLLLADPTSPLGKADIADVNAWLAGTLPKDHNLYGWGSEYHHGDSWGNSFVCVHYTTSQSQLLSRHVYSCGRDGCSNTEGNDPDDLNSWDDNSTEFYVNELNRDTRLRLCYNSLLTLLFVFPLGLYIKRRLFGSPFQRVGNK